jgi:hypothetical protein
MAALFRIDYQENGETEADTIHQVWEKGVIHCCGA